MPDTVTKLPVPRQAAAPISLDDIWKLAQSIAKSGLFGMKTPDQAMALMCIAQAEGRHPALAARDYHIIQGTPAKKAEAMLRDFLESGGRVEWHELDDKAADATFSHHAGGTVRIRWDQARIAQAGLGSNPMHKKYPRQMLRSRCVSEGVRTVYPMATSGFSVLEEIGEFGPQRQAEPIDVTPRADLDAFAGVSPPIDDMHESAMAAAWDGTEHFRAWWKALDGETRKILHDRVPEYRRVAQDADARAADPFDLPPLPQADAGQSEAASDIVFKRSPIWLEDSYRLEPTKDLTGDTDWSKWESDVVFLISEATVPELDKLRADNDDLMKRARREHGDAYRVINDAIAVRRAELAGAAAA